MSSLFGSLDPTASAAPAYYSPPTETASAASVASSVPAATNTQLSMNQAIQDYVSQVMAGNWTDQQKAQMIQSQAAAVGVNADQIAAATGYSPQNVNAYMALANQQQPQVATPVSNSIYNPTEGTWSASQLSNQKASTDPRILAAEQAARQAHMDMGMVGRKQGVDPSVYKTLFGTNSQGQVVRNSDGYVSPISMNSVQNPNAKEYYQQNPQELFALGALGGGGGQGYFMDAGVRGTDKKYGQLTPDQWYRGYTSDFADGWDKDTSNAYRWSGQNTSSGSPSGGSTAGSNGSGNTSGTTGSSGGSNSVVGGMFSDYVPRGAGGVPSNYNPNQAAAGGNSGDYNQQMQSYYKAYFGDSSPPNMNMLDSWYGGQYSPTPTGFGATNKGASSARGIVQSLKWDPANYNSSLMKLNEYRQTYGLSAKDIASAIGANEATVISEFAKAGIVIPVTTAAPVSKVNTNPNDPS